VNGRASPWQSGSLYRHSSVIALLIILCRIENKEKGKCKVDVRIQRAKHSLIGTCAGESLDVGGLFVHYHFALAFVPFSTHIFSFLEYEG
jgi:hypothetical protein